MVKDAGKSKFANKDAITADKDMVSSPLRDLLHERSLIGAGSAVCMGNRAGKRRKAMLGQRD